jgi:hypothetical protein
VSEPKGTAAEVQLLFTLLDAALKPGANLAMKMPSGFVGFHNSSFPQDPNVLGGVIFADFEADGQFTDRARRLSSSRTICTGFHRRGL